VLIGKSGALALDPNSAVDSNFVIDLSALTPTEHGTLTFVNHANVPRSYGLRVVTISKFSMMVLQGVFADFSQFAAATFRASSSPTDDAA
jgi:hypothetical protein